MDQDCPASMDRKDPRKASGHDHVIGRDEVCQNAGAYASNVNHRATLSCRRNQYFKKVQKTTYSNVDAVYVNTVLLSLSFC